MKLNLTLSFYLCVFLCSNFHNSSDDSRVPNYVFNVGLEIVVIFHLLQQKYFQNAFFLCETINILVADITLRSF